MDQILLKISNTNRNFNARLLQKIGQASGGRHGLRFRTLLQIVLDFHGFPLTLIIINECLCSRHDIYS